jgi:hypothetical protein
MMANWNYVNKALSTLPDMCSALVTLIMFLFPSSSSLVVTLWSSWELGRAGMVTSTSQMGTWRRLPAEKGLH